MDDLAHRQRLGEYCLYDHVRGRWKVMGIEDPMILRELRILLQKTMNLYWTGHHLFVTSKKRRVGQVTMSEV